MRRIIEVDAKTGKTVVTELTITKTGTKRSQYVTDYTPDSERTFSEQTHSQLDSIANAVSSIGQVAEKVETPIKLYASPNNQASIILGMPAIFEYVAITIIRGENLSNARVAVFMTDMAGNNIGNVIEETLDDKGTNNGYFLESSVFQAATRYNLVAKVESDQDVIVEFEIGFSDMDENTSP